MANILVINGANLNMLGIREKELYGENTYADLVRYINEEADCLMLDVTIFQSNHEGDIVDTIQKAYKHYDGIIINAGAYTHTSVAILDALKAVAIPTIEVHLTDISNREPFRQFSYISLMAKRVICGKGFNGYKEALMFFANNR